MSLGHLFKCICGISKKTINIIEKLNYGSMINKMLNTLIKLTCNRLINERNTTYVLNDSIVETRDIQVSCS